MLELFLLCFYIVQTDATVEFLAQPRDATVVVGGTARMCCVYQGSNSNPSWGINGLIYNWYSLPPKHHFNLTAKTLFIEKVDRWMNNSKYQCFLPSTSSTIGTLYVLIPALNDSELMSTTLTAVPITDSRTDSAG